MGRPVEDMTGRRIGALCVTGQAGADKGRRMMWTCTCECGRTTTVRGDYLRREVVKSCGQCGAYHPKALSSDNARFLIKAYSSPGVDGGEPCAFAIAFDRVTGAIATPPRIPTYISNPLASALSGLAMAGLIRGKEGRATIPRWAQEEKCVMVLQHMCADENELNDMWEGYTGEPVEKDRYTRPKKAEAVILSPPLELDEGAKMLFSDWYASGEEN
jgi:hypothetical protein